MSRQSRTPLTAESLYTALGDEFRVRMAQEALAGSEFDSSPQVPSLATPREFWDFYRNNLTTIQVALLPVKVEEFTSKIQAKATEAELQELFKQYKNQEYRPESDTPGFKQPRRVQIEWVAGRAESVVYQRKAQELLTSLVATTPSVPLPGFGPILALTHRLQSAYEFLTRETLFEKSPYRLPPLTDQNFVLPMYTAASGPETMADAVCQAAVGTTGNGLLAALTTYQASAVIRAPKSLAGIVTLFLASAQPAPALGLGGTWHVANEEKQLLPFEALSGLLTRQLADKLADNLLVGTLEDIEKEVEKLGKEKDKKGLQDYLNKLRSNKSLGLETGKMTEAKDSFAIADDPALKPFRDAYVRPPARDPQAKQFADMFFRESRLFEPQRWPFNWNTALQPFVYWIVDDKPARTLQFTDPGVREKVEAAWRTLKARELAKKEADEIAVQVRETKGDVQKLRDLGARLKREAIEPLLPLAYLTRPKEALALRAPYRRDELPKELSDKITYPRADMAGEILKLQDKKPGDTVIVTDQPAQVFYVTVLIKQTEPSREEFFRASRGLNLSLGLSNLFELFEKERRENYRKELLVQLRHEAGVDLQAFEDRLKTILRGTGGEE